MEGGLLPPALSLPLPASFCSHTALSSPLGGRRGGEHHLFHSLWRALPLSLWRYSGHSSLSSRYISINIIMPPRISTRAILCAPHNNAPRAMVRITRARLVFLRRRDNTRFATFISPIYPQSDPLQAGGGPFREGGWAGRRPPLGGGGSWEFPALHTSAHWHPPPQRKILPHPQEACSQRHGHATCL